MSRGLKVKEAPRANKDLLVKKERMVYRDLPVKMVFKVKTESQALKVNKVSKDQKVHRERKAIKVIRVNKDLLVKKERMVHKDLKVILVYMLAEVKCQKDIIFR
jgi:hypothetical protein